MEAVDPKGISVFYDFTSTRSALVAGDVISILSIPRKVLFAEPDRVMIRNLTSVGIVAGLVLVLGWIGSRYLVLRPIQALVNFTARLGAGDHSARTGLPRARDELRQLTRAFDQMAEALQQREAERQSAADALKASEMRYRRLFETAQDGILILNADTGQIDDVNPFLTDLLGYTREQLLGNKLWEIWPLQGHQSVQGGVPGVAARSLCPLRRPAAGNQRRQVHQRGVCQQRLSGQRRQSHSMQHSRHHQAQAGRGKTQGIPPKTSSCFPAGWWKCRRPNAGTSRANSTTKSARP